MIDCPSEPLNDSSLAGRHKDESIRLVIISDLHLGGEPPMMSRPERLVAFIDGLPRQLRQREHLELVIAGDFIDFLALPPERDVTTDPQEAVQKLEAVMGHGSKFKEVFDALGRHVAARHRLTVLVGNHDVEMTFPAIQEALLRRIGASQWDVRFVDDGRAYRVGGALIEHGNAYDGANANHWEGLRHLASVQSRHDEPELELVPSAGSRLVNLIVNKFKARYPFVHLLQPEGDLVVLLLLAFEPSLGSEFGSLVQLLHGSRLAAARPRRGVQPMAGYAHEPHLDPELLQAFGSSYQMLLTGAVAAQPISAVGALLRAWTIRDDQGVAAILKRGERIPAQQLARLRVALKKLLQGDDSDDYDGDVQQYGRAAERILAAVPDLQAVVMGHTHLPRFRTYGSGIYINSGTWIDRFLVPQSALNDSSGAELEHFLRELLLNGRSTSLPATFADLLVDTSGRVAEARLRKVDES